VESSKQFISPAEHYDRFMGRYTAQLAPKFADLAGVENGMRVLDVGCGPGGLTQELSQRAGSSHVAAVDPAPQFVEACRARNVGADVREGMAEDLPWADDEFDATLSCLVIRFMRDADKGLSEMARVTKPAGRVAVCMWDIAGGGMTMLRIFWSAMREVDPETKGEHAGAGTAEGDIEARLGRAGLREIEGGSISVSVAYDDFDDFWTPFTFAVGPAGQALAALDPARQQVVKDSCRASVPEGSFSLDARAWFGCGTI
jgi:SAM-dependent methyltransferase